MGIGEIQEEIEELDQKITDKIIQAELLGEEVKIEESEIIMKEIGQIKTQRNLLTNTKDYLLQVESFHKFPLSLVLQDNSIGHLYSLFFL